VNRAQVIYQMRRQGGGSVWVHRPRGGWRVITFASGRTQLAKLAALSRVLGRLGAATTVPLRGCLLVAQTSPGPDSTVPALLPRPGPAPACPQAP
jgi:hypothetical protein